VAAAAREEGCLFARKFTLWDVDPKVKRDGDATPPGNITVEEWRECIGEFAEKVEAKEEVNDGESTKTAEAERNTTE